MAGASLANIITVVRDARHGYDADMIAPAPAHALALFISQGQFNSSAFIDLEVQIIGDAAKGAALFQNQCAACHGFDGQAMNFRSEESPEYLGTVAAEDPAELLHKIRHGNPGAVMPAYLVFGMDIIAAYAQTLPAE
jgi:mono/diheme cytochrome c family protein